MKNTEDEALAAEVVNDTQTLYSPVSLDKEASYMKYWKVHSPGALVTRALYCGPSLQWVSFLGPSPGRPTDDAHKIWDQSVRQRLAKFAWKYSRVETKSRNVQSEHHFQGQMVHTIVSQF